MTIQELEKYMKKLKEYIDRKHEYYLDDEGVNSYSRALTTYLKLKEEWVKKVFKEDL